MRRAYVRWTTLTGCLALAAGAATLGLVNRAETQTTQGFQKGTWDHKSIGALAFAPDGTLFFADDQGGAIFGVALGEKAARGGSVTPVPNLGATIAGSLGTTAAGIQIKDIAISPVSGATYIAVRKTDGADQNPANPSNYALFRVDRSGKADAVDLAALPFSKVALKVSPGRRAGPMITDIVFADGRLLVAGLSTDAFSSNLFSVPVPFKADGVERYATSIYHVSHKKQETASPIQTLTLYQDGKTRYLMAAYVCTPVVRFNLADLKPNEVAKGVTVAELGSGNQPMNMIAYGKSGAQTLLLNNSSFGILKVDGKIATETQAVNEATTADRGGRGAKPYAGIEPVESLKTAKAYATTGDALVVVKATDGGMSLESMPLP